MANVLVMCIHVTLMIAGGAADPQTWNSKDIGKANAKALGTAQYSEEAMIWTVRGGGIDIYGTADSFYYVYQPFRGDGTVIARVESLGKTDPWAKAGVMIRENLDAGTRFAAVYATVLHGVSVQARVKSAGGAVSDTQVKTKEQSLVKSPVWIKLERRGNQFRGYYATDRAGKDWIATAWEPQVIPMSRAVYVGLVVCSHAPGTLCEVRFSNVAVSDAGGEITDLEMLTAPQEALATAYANLEQLGDWRADAEVLKKHGKLIASSLFAIARIGELNGAPAAAVLPDYYRIAELLPLTPSAVDALIRIAILDGQQGLEYAARHLDGRTPEDKDRFHVAVVKDYGSRPDSPAREVALGSFVEYVAKSSRFTSLEQAIADLGSDEQALAVFKSIIQHGMSRPSNVQAAVVGLRYMALRMSQRQTDNRIPELLKWAVSQFPDTKLSDCAMAALADAQYEQGSCVGALETFRPSLFADGQPESKIIESVETALASYRANTMLQATLNPERIYEALGEKAGASGQHAVDLHCRRRIAEMRGLSLEDFEKSALQGVEYCESAPQTEVWFWKGLIAAEEGDLGAAAAAYERFLQGDGRSVLAARACYDIARMKMAMGEDARAWIAKAKALSPCDAVIQLEQRLHTTAAARG